MTGYSDRFPLHKQEGSNQVINEVGDLVVQRASEKFGTYENEVNVDDEMGVKLFNIFWEPTVLLNSPSTHVIHIAVEKECPLTHVCKLIRFVSDHFIASNVDDGKIVRRLVTSKGNSC